MLNQVGNSTTIIFPFDVITCSGWRTNNAEDCRSEEVDFGVTHHLNKERNSTPFVSLDWDCRSPSPSDSFCLSRQRKGTSRRSTSPSNLDKSPRSSQR